MRKYALLFVLAISVLGTTSFAAHPPGWICPKQLRKFQMRQSDGTAFIPGKSSIGRHNTVSTGAVHTSN